MDELTRWQLEEMARRAWEHKAWLERGGALDTARFFSKTTTTLGLNLQMQALSDAIVLRQISPDALRDVFRVLGEMAIPETELDLLFAEAAGAAKIIKSFENLHIDSGLGIRATYAQMVAGLAGIHRAFTGHGAAVAVTFDQDEVGRIEVYERELELPAGGVEDTSGDGLDSDDGTTSAIIRGFLSGAQTTLPVDDQVPLCEPDAPSSFATTHSLEVVNSLQEWSIQRLEGSDGVHRFTFKSYGESARNIIDWLCATTRAFLSNKKSDHPLSFLSETKDAAKEAAAYEEKTINELQSALAAMGYPADRVEQAIEEHRREQQAIEPDEHPGAPQFLTGATIEPTTTIYGGHIQGERDGVVTNRLLAQLIALLESQLATRQPAEERYWPVGYWPNDNPSTSQQKTRRKSGRPRNADDDWAYEQVRVNGRPLTDVYPEWLARIGPRAKTLADPHDSFYKLIRNRNKDKMEKMD